MEGKIKILNPRTGISVELEINLYNYNLNNERSIFESSTYANNALDYFLKTASASYHENKLRGIFEIFYSNKYIGYFSFYFSNIDFNRRGYEKEIQTFINLDYFAIDKSYQRQKIGNAVLGYIIKNFSQLSKMYNCISGIILTPLNVQVAKFYEDFGFIEMTDTSQYILIFE